MFIAFAKVVRRSIKTATNDNDDKGYGSENDKNDATFCKGACIHL
jgi:hypothetical protein